MPLVLVPAVLDNPSLVWEVKYDGFRALAYVERGRCRLFSRTGHEFKRFPDVASALARAVGKRSAVLDGEIAVLGADGRSRFAPLMSGRGVARFCAFDLLWAGGRDLRGAGLLERKARLRELVAWSNPRLLYVEHVEVHGPSFFEAACRMDLEGIVGKFAPGVYRCGGSESSWLKVKNPTYSQMDGRHELFETRREKSPLRRSPVVRPRLVLV